jgi:hypothetical protein
MKLFENIQVREGSVVSFNSNHRKKINLEELGIDKKEWQKKNKIGKDIIEKEKKDEKTKRMRSRKTYTGTITLNAKKRIKKAIQILLQISEKKVIYSKILKKEINFRLNFITLTIPELESASNPQEVYKKLLRPFLQWLSKTEKVKSYIWKLELQQRGAIHYHIITNKYIEYYLIRDKWNNLMRKNDMLEIYKKHHGNYNPNSVDIHNVKEVQDMSIYMEKYLAKNKQNQKELNCKIWDCSYNLKAGKLYSQHPSFQNIKAIKEFEDMKDSRLFESDYYSILYQRKIVPHKILYGYEHKMYEIWKKNIKEMVNNRKLNTRLLPNKKVTKEKIKLNSHPLSLFEDFIKQI